MARGRRLPAQLRWLGRMIALGLGLFVAGIILVQIVQRVEQNYALANELARTQNDIRTLRARDAAEVREIRRLRTAEGVVPYIYRRLRMVRPGQTLIYLVPSPGP